MTKAKKLNGKMALTLAASTALLAPDVFGKSVGHVETYGRPPVRRTPQEVKRRNKSKAAKKARKLHRKNK